MIAIFILILLCLIAKGYFSSKEVGQNPVLLIRVPIAWAPVSWIKVPADGIVGEGFASSASVAFNICFSGASNLIYAQ
jgi:hypothetical protein